MLPPSRVISISGSGPSPKLHGPTVGGPLRQMNAQGLPPEPIAEKKGWIQGAKADIKKRGTEGVCTGSKFGSESCPPGSKRYSLAKEFKSLGKKHKK